MNWFGCFVYGIVSGLTEFLPISSKGHQSLFGQLFGNRICNPVSDLLCHIACLMALLISSRNVIMRIRRDNKSRSNVRRKRNYTSRTYFDMQVVRNAALPLCVALIVCALVVRIDLSSVLLAVFFVLNGLILFLPSRMMHANKDARSMSALDSMLMGALGILSFLPGVSRIGCTTSAAILRGADTKEAYHWSLLISIPVLLVLIILDIISISGVTAASQIGFFSYTLMTIGSFAGAMVSIYLMRSLTAKNGISVFAYYSWGCALLALILYMIV